MTSSSNVDPNSKFEMLNDTQLWLPSSSTEPRVLLLVHLLAKCFDESLFESCVRMSLGGSSVYQQPAGLEQKMCEGPGDQSHAWCNSRQDVQGRPLTSNYLRI